MAGGSGFEDVAVALLSKFVARNGLVFDPRCSNYMLREKKKTKPKCLGNLKIGKNHSLIYCFFAKDSFLFCRGKCF